MRLLCGSVTGNLKDIVSTVIGALYFDDYHPSTLSLAGLGVSFSGALWFSWMKLQASGGLSLGERPSDTKVDGRV